MSYRVKNWRQFQHYRDRNPPWIKLHFAMLASTDWVMLDDASRVLAIACMLIASRNEGVIPDNPAYIKRVAYLNKTPNFKPLIDCGFLEDASNGKRMLADARPETETEDIKKDREEDVGLAPSTPPLAQKVNGELRHQASEILAFLNEKTGRDYQPVPANIELILARLKEGATVLDLRAVVAKKCREWLGDEKMNEFLRPKTLFGRMNYAQYRGELVNVEAA